jgi:hypothetical protein
MEESSARDAGTIGYMSRMFVQLTLPHSKPSTNHFRRSNGKWTVVLMAGNTETGLPYGHIPRLVLSWLTTEAVKQKSRSIALGRSFNSFLTDIGVVQQGRNAGGGPRGQRTTAIQQTIALFGTFVHWRCSEVSTSPNQEFGANARISSEYNLAWNPMRHNAVLLGKSEVTLSEEFFDQIMDRPVPVDMRALKILKGSSMRLDIYMWLTYRMSYLQKPVTVPWEYLQQQFGSGYRLDAAGRRSFKRRFLEQFAPVKIVYQDARAEGTKAGLLLKPSPTHVPRQTPRLVRTTAGKEI